MYCTPQNVEAYYLGKDFKCEDYVTGQEIEGFILTETARINAALRAKYSLPITDADDLKILQMICEKLIVGTVDGIFREKKISDDFDRTRNLKKEANDLLKEIKNGDLILNSSTLTSPMVFNNIDSGGNEVTKRYTDELIEPKTSQFPDRERKTTII